MDAIKNYVNNVFAAYPQTAEVQKLRNEMLANMGDKYEQLRQSGKSEHEAAYGVIADFGNMEELTAELGISAEKKEGVQISVTEEDAQSYLRKSKLYGLLVGFGVWLIIAGVSSVIVMSGIGDVGGARLVNSDILFLFPSIAIAVVMFFAAGAVVKKYANYEESHIVLAEITRERIERAWAKFSPFYTLMIAGGVALIILAVGAVAVFEMPASALLNAIGFAVLLFISASSYGSAFDVLLNEGDYANKVVRKKSNNIIGAVAAIYWPLVTAVYLGLFFMDVGNFWVIWPLAGILFGAICYIPELWLEFKGRQK